MKLERRAVPRMRAAASRASYTDIGYDERIVDAACMQLVMQPEQFDVLLLPESLRRHRVGSVRRAGRRPRRRAGAANLGGDIGVFEAVHGSAPDIAGKNLREPDRAAAVGGDDAASHRTKARRRIESWPRSCIGAGTAPVRTRDLGGTATTTGVR